MGSFSILTGNQVTREMISEAIYLDRITYDDVYQLQVNTCYDYFEKNNDIYIMAVDNRSSHVIGYINFSPIKESVFTKLISGDTIDTTIAGDDVLPYHDGCLYWGYFSSIVVHPDHRRQGIAAQMLFHWSDLILRLAAERNIYFKKIVADAVSDSGVQILSKMGFSLVRSSTHGSKIMTLDLFQNLEVHSKFTEKLLAVYKKYNEKDGRKNVV